MLDFIFVLLDLKSPTQQTVLELMITFTNVGFCFSLFKNICFSTTIIYRNSLVAVY